MLKIYWTKTAAAQQSAQAQRLLRLAWEAFSQSAMPPLLRTPEGKPYFEELPLHFNLSHSGQLAVCAVSDRPVGVDVEYPRAAREPLLRRVFSAREREWITTDEAFARLWTKKEAFCKYTGRGLAGMQDCPPLTLEDAKCGDLYFSGISCCGAVISVCSELPDTPQWIHAQI